MTMKVVSVPNGDYKISVRQGSRNPSHQEYGGNITLDVGTADRANRGTVYITGDLIVEGKSTTVESETMTVKDNIIVINSGENSTSPGPGVTLNTAGITVDRGWKTDTSILFNESVDHLNASGTSTAGTFTFVNDEGDLVGIQTCSISTRGQNLYLIESTGTGVVKEGPDAEVYAKNVFDYTDFELDPPTGPLTIDDPKALPNAKSLQDYVDSTLAFFDDYAISEGDTSVECIEATPGPYNYYRTLLDPLYDGPANSKITFKVDGTRRGQFTALGLNVDNVNIFTNTITTLDPLDPDHVATSSDNLILTADTTTVQIDAVLQLDDTGLSPTAVAGSTKIYTVNSNTTPAPGKTGIYFTNQGNSDELVAKNRALLFSILF